MYISTTKRHPVKKVLLSSGKPLQSGMEEVLVKTPLDLRLSLIDIVRPNSLPLYAIPYLVAPLLYEIWISL